MIGGAVASKALAGLGLAVSLVVLEVGVEPTCSVKSAGF